MRDEWNEVTKFLVTIKAVVIVVGNVPALQDSYQEETRLHTGLYQPGRTTPETQQV